MSRLGIFVDRKTLSNSEQLNALTSAVAARGVTVSSRENRNALLSIEKGNLIASLWLTYASTTTDAPEPSPVSRR